MCMKADAIKFARRVLDETVDRTTLCVEALELIDRAKEHKGKHERQVRTSSE